MMTCVTCVGEWADCIERCPPRFSFPTNPTNAWSCRHIRESVQDRQLAYIMERLDFSGSWQRLTEIPGVRVRGTLHLGIIIRHILSGGSILPSHLRESYGRIIAEWAAIDTGTEQRLRACILANIDNIHEKDVTQDGAHADVCRADVSAIIESAAASMAHSQFVYAEASAAAPHYDSELARLHDFRGTPPLKPYRAPPGRQLRNYHHRHSVVWPQFAESAELSADRKERIRNLFDCLSASRKAHIHIDGVEDLFYRHPGQPPPSAAAARAKARPGERVSGALRLMKSLMSPFAPYPVAGCSVRVASGASAPAATSTAGASSIASSTGTCDDAALSMGGALPARETQTTTVRKRHTGAGAATGASRRAASKKRRTYSDAVADAGAAADVAGIEDGPQLVFAGQAEPLTETVPAGVAEPDGDASAGEASAVGFPAAGQKRRRSAPTSH